MKKLLLAASALAAAGAAFAASPPALGAPGPPSPGAPPADALGSIISSFRMSPAAEPFALGIYRDPSYVYGIMYAAGTDYLYRFTAAGVRVASFALSGTTRPRGADPAHLGPGYLSVVDADAKRLYVFRTTGGSAVTSFAVAGAPYPLNCFWDGTYYHVNGSNNLGRFNRYRTGGAAAGSWTCAGWPGAMTTIGGAAFANRGNNGAGPYFVACSFTTGQPMCMTTYPAGSLVRTWSMPNFNGNGLCYGDSSAPASYGAAVWANWYTAGGMWAHEIDVDARGASTVRPASLGIVKSLYR